MGVCAGIGDMWSAGDCRGGAVMRMRVVVAGSTLHTRYR